MSDLSEILAERIGRHGPLPFDVFMDAALYHPEHGFYAIPTNADNRILYWNRKIFREKAAELRAARLDPDRAPRTWSETLRYSKVLTERRPDGSLLRGVRFDKEQVTTETVVMRSATGTVRWIKNRRRSDTVE